MTALKLDKYGGMLPAWDTTLLPEGQADYSVNCYLYSGTLTGWRQPKVLRELRNSAAKYVYRIPNNDTKNTSITADDCYWLEFEDPDTTVMHSPVVQDQYQRYYFADTTGVPKYNTYQRIADDKPAWTLGVPASGCTPGVSVEGGGDTMPVGYPNVSDSAIGAQYVPGQHITFVPIVPSGSMIIESISFNPSTFGSSTVTGIGAVYTDLNGKPYQLIGETASTILDLSQTSQTLVFTNGISVVSNTTYWLGIMTDQSFYLETVDDTTLSKGYVATFTNGPPDTLNQGALVTAPTFRIWGNLIGASIFEARGYVYTWVTEYGEEGPPSEPVVVNGWSNATWTLTLFQPEDKNLGDDYPLLDGNGDPVLDGNNDPVLQPAERNITHTRIYRTISNQAGMGTYFLVAEVPVEQGVYVDILQDDVVALNTQLLSLYWYPPPEDLQAIMAFPNGVAVGFRSNEVWFSEAYRPHAWPPGYVLTTEFPIVGIGVAAQSIVVCTKGTPYLINGINPASMALTKINLTEPCLHRGSIVATDTAVLYVSQNGLIQISQSGAGLNTTEGWITREKWQQLTPVSRIRAIKHATSYFAFGATTADDPIRVGFTIELSSEDKTSFTIWPQAGGHRLGFNLLTSPNDFDIDNVEIDPWTGVGLLVQNGAVYYYDFTDQNPTIIPYLWRSKIYQQAAVRNYEAMKIWFTVPGTTPEQGDRDTSTPQAVLGANQYGIVRVYRDGTLWTTREIYRSGELLRIISGIKAVDWQFELEGRVTIQNMQVATSVKELAQV